MMTSHYTHVELISPHHPAYRDNNRRYKRISIDSRPAKASDYFSSNYGAALLRWELAVQRLLNKLVLESEDRILRYYEGQPCFRYREIDFIAQPTQDQLIFCEIKLKETFRTDLKQKSSGWKQLNKSLSIVNTKFSDICGLAICIDMSHIYGLDTKAKPEDYCSIADLAQYLSTPSDQQTTLWLSSLEMAGIAIQHGLLTQEDVDEMSVLFREYKDPWSVLDNQSYIPNNVFACLGSFEIEVPSKHQASHASPC